MAFTRLQRARLGDPFSLSFLSEGVHRGQASKTCGGPSSIQAGQKWNHTGRGDRQDGLGGLGAYIPPVVGGLFSHHLPCDKKSSAIFPREKSTFDFNIVACISVDWAWEPPQEFERRNGYAVPVCSFWPAGIAFSQQKRLGY